MDNLVLSEVGIDLIISIFSAKSPKPLPRIKHISGLKGDSFSMYLIKFTVFKVHINHNNPELKENSSQSCSHQSCQRSTENGFHS